MTRILRLLLLASLSGPWAAALIAQTPATASAKPEPTSAPAQATDRASAYYHSALAHVYEEQAAVYGDAGAAEKAIKEYRLAIEADPSSQYLTAGLAELYVKTGRIRDAVVEAQDIIKRDPTNLEARRLLGRIYLRSLGDATSGKGSESVLKLAIEQFDDFVFTLAGRHDHLARFCRLERGGQ